MELLRCAACGVTRDSSLFEKTLHDLPTAGEFVVSVEDTDRICVRFFKNLRDMIKKRKIGYIESQEKCAEFLKMRRAIRE